MMSALTERRRSGFDMPGAQRKGGSCEPPEISNRLKLEVQLQRHLDEALAIIGSLTKGSDIDMLVWRSQVGMIEGIKELGPIFEFRRLAQLLDRKVFVQTNIIIPRPGRTELTL